MIPKKQRSSEKASILIVEDEIIVAMELREKIQAMGWRVSGLATSGSEALVIAKGNRPDLVLMDITIKGEMDGIETARRLHARYRIPIIFITAFIKPGLRRPFKSRDAIVWLSKPLVDEDLLRAIRTALASRRRKTKTARSARPKRISRGRDRRGHPHGDV